MNQKSAKTTFRHGHSLVFRFHIAISQKNLHNPNFKLSLYFDTRHKERKTQVFEIILLFQHKKHKSDFFNSVDFSHSITRYYRA